MINLTGKTIFVADDELGFREIMSDELHLAGAQVVLVESGDKILSELDRQSIDAVVSDIRMPGIDGLKMLDLLKQRNRELPVFLLTGFSDSQTEEIYHRGAESVFSKPCNMDRLVEAIARALLPPAERLTHLPTASGAPASMLTLTLPSKKDLWGPRVNLGRGGLFIQSTGGLPKLNTEVHFTLRLLEDQLEFQGVGVCKWTRSIEGTSEPIGFGLQFLMLEPEANTLFLEWLAKDMSVAVIPNGPGKSQ